MGQKKRNEKPNNHNLDSFAQPWTMVARALAPRPQIPSQLLYAPANLVALTCRLDPCLAGDHARPARARCQRAQPSPHSAVGARRSTASVLQLQQASRHPPSMI